LRTTRITIVLLVLGTAGCPSKQRQVVTAFYAASLTRSFAELERRLEDEFSDLDLRLEPSGSQVAARKVCELNRRADLVFVADWRVIEKLLVPGHADWQIQFAANELVLAHAEHSPYTETISADNWPELLLKPEVRLGRGDETTAPIGFQTLQLWELAEQHYGPGKVGEDLAGRLKRKVEKEHVVPDIVELVVQLQAKAIDYAFVFRSIAEEHNLKVVRLPDTYNLGNPRMGQIYSRTSVPVSLKTGAPPTQIRGAPIVYGVTIPKTAPNPSGAARVIAFLLSKEGRRILERSGFRPLDPPLGLNSARLPSTLKGMVADKP
jgi:molybdate/tungstate transport system substrate-binding protein